MDGEPRLRYANALFCRDDAVLAAERAGRRGSDAV